MHSLVLELTVVVIEPPFHVVDRRPQSPHVHMELRVRVLINLDWDQISYIGEALSWSLIGLYEG